MTTLHATSGDVELHTRENMWDIGIVAEVESQPLYHKALVLLKQGDVVVDLGAHVGAFSVLAALRGASVIAIEPDCMSFALLKMNTERFGAQVECVNAAVDSVSHLRQFASNRINAGASGFFGYEHEGVSVAIVQTTTLKDILGDRRVRLLKMDAEHAEWDVLMPGPVWEQVDAIVMEYHSGAVPGGGSPVQLVNARLRACGFTRIEPTDGAEIGGIKLGQRGTSAR